MAFHPPRLDRQLWRCRGRGNQWGRVMKQCAQHSPWPVEPPTHFLPRLLCGLTVFAPRSMFTCLALFPCSCQSREACHLGSRRGANQGGKEVFLMSRKLGAVPQNKRVGQNVPRPISMGRYPREREQALELMDGQLPNAFSRISELLALNTRTQKDFSEQRGGQGRQIEWELYKIQTQKKRVASCR